jgi:hypothetical protein
MWQLLLPGLRYGWLNLRSLHSGIMCEVLRVYEALRTTTSTDMHFRHYSCELLHKLLAHGRFGLKGM